MNTSVSSLRQINESKLLGMLLWTVCTENCILIFYMHNNIFSSFRAKLNLDRNESFFAPAIKKGSATDNMSVEMKCIHEVYT